MPSNILSKKSICIVTGPTKGIGKSIALQLSANLPKGSAFILLSRTESLLLQVAEEINKNHDVHAVYEVFHQDSLDQDVFDNVLQKCMGKLKYKTEDLNFEQAILINNAGSLEPLDYFKNLDNLTTVASYMQGNLVGCCVLTAKFLQIFTPPLMRVIINLSSLAAIKPMKSWSLYCMGKAARDMQMKVIAAEETQIRTLNYAPGPVETDMTNYAQSETKDPELKKWFQDSFEAKSLLQADATVSKLIKILKEDSFENGAHIDYYD